MIKDQFDPKSINLSEFEGKFTDSAFLSCLGKDSKKLGEKLVYDALKLYFCHKSDKTPMFEKSRIAGALGYLSAEYDAIPDTMPVFGLKDDEAVIAMVLSEVAQHIDESVETAAKQKLALYF